MFIIGILLIVVGVAAAGLLFTGSAPAVLLDLPVPLWGWLAIAVLGVVLLVFNRRPAD